MRHRRAMGTAAKAVSLWRGRARFLAYVNLVLCILALAYIVLMIILGVGTTVVYVAHGDEIKAQIEMNTSTKYLNVYMWITWFVIAMQVLITFIEMWATIMLLKATKKGEKDFNLALCRAEIWRIVCGSFFILNVLLCFYAVDPLLSLAMQILFRGIFFFVVCKFMLAIKQALQTSSIQFYTHSVVVKS